MNQDRINRYRKISRELDAMRDSFFELHCFGDYLAERDGYKSLQGIDAVHFHLIQKHGWTPEQLRSLSPEDMRFCLKEEMADWQRPPEADVTLYR